MKPRRNPNPPRARKHDATELRMIRAGLTERALARHKLRTERSVHDDSEGTIQALGRLR